MNQQGGIGCGTVFGACIFAAAALMAGAVLVDGPGSIGATVMLLVWTMPGLGLGAWMVQSGLRDAATRRNRVAASIERQILNVAAAHKGRISPAMVTMEVQGLDIAGAKRQLDTMAREGYCTVDSDDAGRPYYTFPIGPPTTDDVSPEDWVKQVSGARPRTRMTGEQADEQTTSAEA